MKEIHWSIQQGHPPDQPAKAFVGEDNTASIPDIPEPVPRLWLQPQ